MEEEPTGTSEMCVFGVGCGIGCFIVLKEILGCKKKRGGAVTGWRTHPDAEKNLKF